VAALVDTCSSRRWASMPERYAEMGGFSRKEAYLTPFTYIAVVESCENKA